VALQLGNPFKSAVSVPVNRSVRDEIVDKSLKGQWGDLALLIGHDSKAHAIALKGSSKANYPFDGSSVTRLEDFFGAAAAKLRNQPMSPQQAWRRNGMFRRVVTLRAGCIATIPFRIIKGKDKVVYDSEFEHRYPKSLAWLRGNKKFGYVNFRRLLALTELSLILEGRAAWGLDVKMGTLRGIRWWAPQWWEPHYNETFTRIEDVQRTLGREYDRLGADGMRITTLPGAEHGGLYWPLEYVALFFQQDPYCEAGNDDWNSEGRTAAVHASVLHAFDTFLYSHLSRGLLKATLVRVPRGTDEAERRKFRTRFARVQGGRGERTMTLEADSVEVQEIGEGIGELSRGIIERQQGQFMCTAVGVPHGIVMSGETNSKADGKEDKINLYDHTVIPRAIFIQDEANEEVFYDRGLRMEFKLKSLAVKRDQYLKQAQEYQILTGEDKMWSREFARREMGVHEKDEWLEDEIKQAKEDEKEVLRNAPGGMDGGNNPDFQDPRQRITRSRGRTDRNRENGSANGEMARQMMEEM